MWLEKYSPQSIDELTIHKDITERLKKLSRHKDLPHIIFYGAPGGGKSTRINCLIKEIFKDEKIIRRPECITNAENKININVVQSNYHLELQCFELGNKDKIIVQSIIKELCSYKSSASFFSKTPMYRIFVFKDAEFLSEGAQAGLRRTLETYIRNARVILHLEHLSKIIEPLKSRCICIRVPLPSEEEIYSVLQNICKNENVSPSFSTFEYFQTLINTHGRNLRKCIMALEMSVYANSSKPHESLSVAASYINELCDFVFINPTQIKMKECVTKIQSLITCQIPVNFIFETTIKYLLRGKYDAKLKYYFLKLCSHFSYLSEASYDKSVSLIAFIVNANTAIVKYNLHGK
ncbi:replication factor C subunit 5, putative [Plasmodium sp. gorilla clade G2]|uniref:replication factor C subunit 5, putative n=1 Tax=Plasmodium sp. gorilla clade G2 TaxID=880535 RepID=UPI000D2024DE|nr:replication factor C subunit 5, putative [Plasmodium sp. gorilla clade G2]SOV15435.1 replication factor C subunit 5, putative [Plasmodium sp. gorilla clade G2]